MTSSPVIPANAEIQRPRPYAAQPRMEACLVTTQTLCRRACVRLGRRRAGSMVAGPAQAGQFRGSAPPMGQDGAAQVRCRGTCRGVVDTQEVDMADLLEILESFNRKERFFLVGEALGNKNFALSGDFRRNLSNTIRLEIPKDPFVAMDYHLDWLSISLFMTSADSTLESVFENNDLIDANQEDADLLVAFSDNESYHLVLLEAKGYTGWSNSQMASKANRMHRIFGYDGKRFPGVIPHYCLVSPRMPSGLDITHWPEWMYGPGDTPNWMSLNLPYIRRKPTRCDAKGNASAAGGYIRIDNVVTADHAGTSTGASARSSGGAATARPESPMVMRQREFASTSKRWEVMGQVTGSFRDPFNRPVRHGWRVRADDGREYVVGRGYARKYLGISWI